MSETPVSLLSCSHLCVTVPGRDLVTDLDFGIDAGEFVAVLGQNGAGKTLTLMTLAGLRPPDRGVVRLDGASLGALPRNVIAKRLALMPQSVDDIFPATALDTALIGRHPHVSRLRWESADDRDIAVRALDTMGVGNLCHRDVLTLSGGERRRVAVAQVLAQSPTIYLLDEPTNHLDLQHQLDVLHVFRQAADNGAAVIAALHDINLASRFADRCLLLHGDGRWELGDAGGILTADRLAALYGTAIEAVDWRGGTLFVASGNSAR